LHAEAAAWFHSNLLKAPAAQEARKYLKSRDVSVEITKSWLLGYAPESQDALIDFLHSKQFLSEEIAQSGLSAARDEKQDPEAEIQNPQLYARFRGRVMFPIRNDYGEVIAFSGRVLDPEAKTAKYVNSPETPLFTKGRVLYGLDKSKRALIEASTAVVCEGQLDLISAFEAGVQNVIAPQGTAFTPEQARLLRRFVDTVILCFDSDRAGQQAIGRSLPALLECGLQVRVASLPEGEDPDSFIRARGVSRFREIIDSAPGFFDHAIQRLSQMGTLDDPAGKSSAARQLGPLVAAINDSVLRETTARIICARLGITETAFATRMKPGAIQSATADTESRIKPLSLNEGIRQLCRLSLIDPAIKAWLAQQSSPAPRELGEGGDLLEKILQSSLSLHEAPARAAFVSALTPQEEITVNMLDLNGSHEHATLIAQNLWFGLAAAFYRNQRSVAAAQLHKPGLSPSERTRLQVRVTEASKQILDLQSCLHEL
jgi:DNA primase